MKCLEPIKIYTEIVESSVFNSFKGVAEDIAEKYFNGELNQFFAKGVSEVEIKEIVKNNLEVAKSNESIRLVNIGNVETSEYKDLDSLNIKEAFENKLNTLKKSNPKGRGSLRDNGVSVLDIDDIDIVEVGIIDDVDAQLDEDPAENITKHERIKFFHETRFAGLADSHIKFQKYFSNLLFKSTILDTEKETIYSYAEFDSSVKNMLNNIFNSDNVFINRVKNTIEQDATLDEKRNALKSELATVTKSEIRANESDYFDLISFIDFDTLIATYDTAGVIQKNGDDYSLFVKSNMEDNIIISKDEINADKVASDLYRYIIDNIELRDNDNKVIENKFLTTKMVGYFLPKVFNDPAWQRVNPVEEFAQIIKEKSKDSSLSYVDRITARSIYNKLFADNNSFKSIINKGSFDSSTASKLLTAVVGELIAVADQVPLTIKSSDKEGRPFELQDSVTKTGTKNRMFDSMENHIINSYLDVENSFLKDLSIRGNKITVDQRVYEIESGDITDHELELFVNLTNQTLSREMVDLVQKISTPAQFSNFKNELRTFIKEFALFAQSLNNSLNDEPNIYLNNVYSSGVSSVNDTFDDLVSLLRGEDIEVDIADISPVKFKNSSVIDNYIQVVKDIIYQFSPKATYENAEGNQTGRLGVTNPMSQIKAIINRFRAEDNSTLQDNIFVQDPSLITRVAKLDGARTFYEGISHKRFNTKDNLDVEINFLYFQRLLDTGGKSFFISPSVYSDKSYDGVVQINSTNLDTTINKEAVETVIEKIYNNVGSYYRNLETKIISDYSTALNTTATTLEELNQELTNKSITFEQISEAFSNANLKATENIHYSKNNYVNPLLINKINVFKTQESLKTYLNEQLLKDIKIKNKEGFKLDRNIHQFIESDLSGIDAEDVEEFLIDQDDPDFGYKIAIEVGGETKIHPAFEKYFYDWILFSESTVQTVFGIPQLDSDKSATAAFLKSLKRYNGPSAPVKPYVHGIDKGIPEQTVEAVVEDPTMSVKLFGGTKEGYEKYDGSAFTSPIFMRQLHNSLGGEFGQQPGIHHKDINHAIDFSTGFISLDKRLRFHITNEWMRNTKYDGEENFYEIHKAMLSSIEANIVIPESIAKRYITYSYNPETNKVQTNQLKAGTYKTMFDLWNALGGENTIIFDDKDFTHEISDGDNEMKFRYSSFDPKAPEKMTLAGEEYLTNASDIIVDIIHVIKKNTTIDYNQSYVSSTILKSSRKRGNANINTRNHFVKALQGSSKLNTTTTNLLNLGVQLSTDKEAEDKILTLSTQSLGAIALGGLSHEATVETYEAIKELIKVSIPEDLANSIKQLDKVKLKEAVADIVERSVKDTNIGSIANQIFDYAKTELNGNIPFDHPQLFKLIVSSMNSFLTGTAIRQKLAGSQLVLAPPVKVFRLDENPYMNEDFWWGIHNDYEPLKQDLITTIELLYAESERPENLEELNNLQLLDILKSKFSLDNFKEDLRPAILKLADQDGNLVEYDDIGSPIEDLVQDYRENNNYETRKKVDDYLYQLQSKVDPSKTKDFTFYDKDGNVLYQSTPGEIIAPFNNINKYKGAKRGMSISQIKSKLKGKQLKHFNFQLFATNERIPLQSLASMMSNKTIGFIYSMQSSGMVNHTHQLLTGGDFDVDKTNYSLFEVYGDKKDHVQRKGKNGEVILWFDYKNEEFEKWNKSVEEIKSSSYYNSLSPEEKIAALRNYVLYQKLFITLSPTNISVRETPVGTNTIKSFEARREQLNSESDVVEFNENIPSSRAHMKYENHSAKQVVGIAATAIKLMSVLHHSLHKTIKEIERLRAENKITEANTLENYIKNIPLEINIYGGSTNYSLITDTNWSLVSPNEASRLIDTLSNETLESNESPEEFINKVLKKFANDQKQYDFLGEMLNAAVDNAKELILKKVNAIPLTANLWTTMSLMGVNTNTIADIMIQPEVDAAIEIAGKSFRNEKYTSLADAIEIIAENPLEATTKTDKAVKDIVSNFLAKEASVFKVYFGKTRAAVEKELKTSGVTEENMQVFIIKYINDNLYEAADKDLINDLNEVIFKLRNNSPSYKTYIYNQIKDFIRYTSVNKSIGRSSEDISANLSRLRTVLDYSKPLQVMSQLLGINQGLGSSEYKLFKYKYSIEAHFNEVTEKELDFIKFIEDPAYRNEMIDVYDKSKTSINILFHLSNSPYFMELFNTLAKSSKWGNEVSFKLRELDKLIKKFVSNEYLTDYMLGSITEDKFNKFASMLDEVAIDNYYQTVGNLSKVKIFSSNISTKGGKLRNKVFVNQELNLAEAKDRQHFIDFMNNYIIPKLKSKFTDNEFLKAFELSNTTRDGFGVKYPEYRMIFDPNSLSSDAAVTQEMKYYDGLSALNTFVKMKKGDEEITVNPLDLLVHYNRLVNRDGLVSKGFTKYIPKNKVTTSYWDALATMNDTFDIDKLLTSSEALEYLMVKYNLTPFINEFDTEKLPKIYKTKDGKEIKVKVKRGDYHVELYPISRFINFNYADLGFTFIGDEIKVVESDEINNIMTTVTNC